MKYVIILLLISSMLFSACNKDNPSTKKIAGLWNITEYTVNGIDSVNIFDSTFYTRSVEIIADEPGDDYDNNMIYYGDIIGEWRLDKEKSLLTINNYNWINDDSFFFGPIMKGIVVEWNITFYEKNEMWIETNYKNNHYLLKLHNINKQF